MRQKKRAVKKSFIIAVFVFFVSAGLYFYYNANKTLSPYEYIRQANKYIEEGKCGKAIKRLNKAYSVSTRSDSVNQSVSYGYLQCAAHYNRLGKVDKAIEILEDRYIQDESNENIVRNLSFLYVKRAVEYAQSGDFDRAVEYCRSGMALAMTNSDVRRSISNYLFNMAVSAYSKNDSDTVIMCLKGSYILWKRADTLELLGQYYYARSSFEDAHFYWAKALELNPDNIMIREKVEKVKKDISAAEDMRTVSLKHFNVRMHKAYNFDIDSLMIVLENAYSIVGKDLGYYIDSNTPVIFYTKRDFRSIFKQPYIVRGFYDGSIRMPVPEGLSSGLFQTIITHEYTHAVISILTEMKSPVWLNEGIATYEQAHFSPVPILRVKKYVASGKTLKLDDLEKWFKSDDHEDTLTFCYEAAYSAVSFIVEEWGISSLRGFLRRIRDGRHYRNAIDEEFFVSTKMFESMWNDHVKTRL